MRKTALLCILLIFSGCSRPASEVRFAMWAGEEDRNRYFRGPFAQELSQLYGIALKIVPYSDTAEVVNKLLTEKSAGRDRDGSIDLVWINGENFLTARQGNVLYGPFTSRLAHLNLYPELAAQRDFGVLIEGREAPWQRAQFVFACDSAKLPDPPRSFEALANWVKAHPGRFTYIAPPDFTGSAFIRHVLLHFGDGTAAFQNFDETHYRRASGKAIEYLAALRPYLWRNGETYPSTLREQNRLFANSEVDFAMSYGPSFASIRIERGEFPPTTRTFLFDSGTIGNYSYLAIPFNAPNINGAITVIDDLMSFRRNLELSRTLKSPFPLSLDKLTAGQRKSVDALPRGVATLPDAVLSSHFLPEPHSTYLTRFEKDWQEKVLRR